MKIVEANVMEIDEPYILKKIELCGRTCYKSEDKITGASHISFVKMLLERKHMAMTEHAIITLQVTSRIATGISRLGHGTYLNVTLNGKDERYIVSGSVRAWYNLFTSGEYNNSVTEDIIYHCECYMQMSLGDDLYKLLFPHAHEGLGNRNYMLTQKQILKLPNLKEYEAKAHLYLTAHFICDRGVSHELVRHRPASFAQESTRYCNYQLDKFCNEITVIKPCFFEQWDKELGYRCETMKYGLWARSCEAAEKTYFELLKEGATPQEARSVLPNSLKTEIVMTCNLAEWQHVINLRYHGTTGAPHPQMLEIMTMWYNYIKQKEGYKDWIK